MAFLFGLVHGLVFAGALKEIGLLDQHLWLALLTFNLGVELGQLLTVAAAGLIYALVKRFGRFSRFGRFGQVGRYAVAAPTRVATLYVIGTLAAYWSLARIVTILG